MSIELFAQTEASLNGSQMEELRQAFQNDPRFKVIDRRSPGSISLRIVGNPMRSQWPVRCRYFIR